MDYRCEICNVGIIAPKIKTCKNCGYLCYELDACDKCIHILYKPEKDPDLCYSCAN